PSRAPRRSNLFPCTTLFRSREVVQGLEGARSGSALATRTSKARSAVRWLGTPLALFSTLLGLGAFAGLLWVVLMEGGSLVRWIGDRKSTRLNSSQVKNSYAV